MARSMRVIAGRLETLRLAYYDIYIRLRVLYRDDTQSDKYESIYWDDYHDARQVLEEAKSTWDLAKALED